MKKILALLLVALFISTAFRYLNTEITKAEITFQIKNLGINTHGTIGGLQADVRFNPADLTASTLEASVDVNTLNTGNATRDEHLKTDDFFDVAHYPRITLKSVSFKHKGGDNYAGVFDLTIKNKTKQVSIPFTYSEKDGKSAFKGDFKINRLDYGVGGSSLIMSNEVTVSIVAEAGR